MWSWKTMTVRRVKSLFSALLPQNILSKSYRTDQLWVWPVNTRTSALLPAIKDWNQCFSYRRFFASWDASWSIRMQVESFGRLLCAKFWRQTLKNWGFGHLKMKSFPRGAPPDPHVSCWVQVRTALGKSLWNCGRPPEISPKALLGLVIAEVASSKLFTHANVIKPYLKSPSSFSCSQT